MLDHLGGGGQPLAQAGEEAVARLGTAGHEQHRGTGPAGHASCTRNDEAGIVRLPRVRTDIGWIRIEPVGNVFLDLNDAELAVTG